MDIKQPGMLRDHLMLTIILEKEVICWVVLLKNAEKK